MPDSRHRARWWTMSCSIEEPGKKRRASSEKEDRGAQDRRFRRKKDNSQIEWQWDRQKGARRDI